MCSSAVSVRLLLAYLMDSARFELFDNYTLLSGGETLCALSVAYIGRFCKTVESGNGVLQYYKCIH